MVDSTFVVNACVRMIFWLSNYGMVEHKKKWMRVSE